MSTYNNASASSLDVPPKHLGTAVPAGGFDGTMADLEKGVRSNSMHGHGEKGHHLADEDEDEDMDALIEELESQDGHFDEEDEDMTEPGGARPVPPELLSTDTRIGLTEDEVLNRRKKYGLNQMKEAKENLILKFLGYFVGPIQFVMEVRLKSDITCRQSTSQSGRFRAGRSKLTLLRLPLFSLLDSRTGLTLVLSAHFCSLMQRLVSCKSFKLDQSSKN